MNETIDVAWDINALGDEDPLERAEWYEELSDGQDEDHFFFGDSKSALYENPRLDARIFTEDGSELPPSDFSNVVTLKNAAG